MKSGQMLSCHYNSMKTTPFNVYKPFNVPSINLSLQLPAKRWKKIQEYIRNWQLTKLWITLSHSPVCSQCCAHRHTCSVHNMHRRREEEVCCASLSKAMLRLWKLHTRRCHMNSNRHQSADLGKVDTTEGVVAKNLSPLQALHPT